MGNFIKYTYYRIYIWNLTNWGESDMPQFNALYGISFLICSNLLAILEIAQLIYGKFMPESNENIFIKVVVGSLAILIALINYLLFVKDGKYKIIESQFINETKEQKRIGTIKIGLYIFFTFSVPITVAILIHRYRS